MTRENLIVSEESTGQQFRFGMPGARLTSQEIEECQNLLRELNPPPEYLVLSGSLPPDVPPDLYGQIAQSMPSSCRVVLDTSGPALVEGISIRDLVYLIKPNVRELGQLAGCAIEDDSQIEEVARSLITQSKVKVVVTSLGSGGASLTTADEHRLIRAPTVRIRSKVGAGDSMVAGIVAALARHASLFDAICYGVAAGSAAVMTEGTALCRREDTESLYRKMC
jgi:6-phosphofructokinase 2